MSKATFKEPWPLSVEEGRVQCVPASAVTFTAPDKTIYAVNGLARGRAKKEGWKEIDLIWLENPAIPGTKVNIGPLIDLGLSLCK